MKTTLYLPESLHRKAKSRAAELGMTLTNFLRNALERALAEPKPGGKYRFQPKTVNMGKELVDVSSRRLWMDKLD